jgi:hypothetical protein
MSGLGYQRRFGAVGVMSVLTQALTFRRDPQSVKNCRKAQRPALPSSMLPLL